GLGERPLVLPPLRRARDPAVRAPRAQEPTGSLERAPALARHGARLGALAHVHPGCRAPAPERADLASPPRAWVPALDPLRRFVGSRGARAARTPRVHATLSVSARRHQPRLGCRARRAGLERLWQARADFPARCPLARSATGRL